MLISAADLASLEATLELLSDFEAMARLARADADVAAGNVVTGEEMAAGVTGFTACRARHHLVGA